MRVMLESFLYYLKRLLIRSIGNTQSNRSSCHHSMLDRSGLEEKTLLFLQSPQGCGTHHNPEIFGLISQNQRLKLKVSQLNRKYMTKLSHYPPM